MLRNMNIILICNSKNQPDAIEKFGYKLQQKTPV